MISAMVTKATRKRVYARDGWRCALCDSTDGIQIHHVEWRGRGGSDDMTNLITLCWRCHGEAHGSGPYNNAGFTMEDYEQACVEYLADYYAGKVRF